MEVSNFIAGFATVISVFSVGLTIYFQFFYVKNDISLYIVSLDRNEVGTINISLILHNKGNVDISIINCQVLYVNHQRLSFLEDSDLFTPFVIKEKEQIIVNVISKIPEIPHDINEEVRIKMKINYVNYKGEFFTDSFYFGEIYINNKFDILNSFIDYTPHKLLGDKTTHGMRDYTRS
ncbi:MAG: hypothetical protein QM660_14755 [Dysgonomonas sp.]